MFIALLAAIYCPSQPQVTSSTISINATLFCVRSLLKIAFVSQATLLVLVIAQTLCCVLPARAFFLQVRDRKTAEDGEKDC